MINIASLPEGAIVQHDGELRTDSLKVAMAFNKRHDDILRKIKSLECSETFTARNFAVSKYGDSTGRSLPMYEMTKDGFMFLVMGFTGKKAAVVKEAYIDAFNAMSEKLAAKESLHQKNAISLHDPEAYALRTNLYAMVTHIEYIQKYWRQDIGPAVAVLNPSVHGIFEGHLATTKALNQRLISRL